ncbi:MULTISPECIES: sensor domain-containing diguanylate cyclase [Nostoc]|uniref:Sensor domain-containing diguanylate cyclase n=1 Tax=Nostoc paludosum FACHB-159 TaxID=2692908 RepID=A0ABR8K3N1_9NOSO|nr:MULTISPECIES: sensor domain-containing diguanylate cyclase [Nostoc]MBD2681790.1 sensor domain-containing diguanylate cyclase [Nostoc sp. FACHB-857]MBD2733548.1 sensor domain-containing diguanylate cyclase [Nostoc paludosum FACHB-159]
MDLQNSASSAITSDSNSLKTEISYVQAMEHLIEVVRVLSLARTLEEIMAIVRKSARELTGADGATFVLRDGDQCFYADEDAIAPLWKGQRFPMSICIGGYTMRNCQPVVISDIYGDERIPFAAYQPTFVKSLAMVPIRMCNPIGAIGTYWAKLHQPTLEQVKLLQALADTTAVAMENVQIYSELEQRVRNRTATLEKEIEECQKVEAEVRRLSLTDELTGLYNRRGFFLLTQQQLKLAHRRQKPCCLLFIDIDGLKQINDTFGHEVGDRVIVDTAELLKQTYRDSDIIARLGGDEFVVFMPESSDCTNTVSARLQRNVDFFNHNRGRSYHLSISVGVKQCFLNEDFSLEKLIFQADELMYQQKRAKLSSTNQFC